MLALVHHIPFTEKRGMLSGYGFSVGQVKNAIIGNSNLMASQHADSAFAIKSFPPNEL